MGDRVKVDDTGEELLLGIGLRRPIGNLFQNLGVASLRIIEAGSVNQCDSCPIALKRVRLDLLGALSLLESEPNLYSSELSYKNKDHRSL